MRKSRSKLPFYYELLKGEKMIWILQDLDLKYLDLDLKNLYFHNHSPPYPPCSPSCSSPFSSPSPRFGLVVVGSGSKELVFA